MSTWIVVRTDPGETCTTVVFGPFSEEAAKQWAATDAEAVFQENGYTDHNISGQAGFFQITENPDDSVIWEWDAQAMIAPQEKPQ